MHVKSYKVINDNRNPIIIEHKSICYPPALNQDLIDSTDICFPGIVIDFQNGYYLLEDGCHRIHKHQKNGVYESLFYVVTIQEYKDGMVDMIYGENFEKRITLGEWNHKTLDLMPHSM